MIILAFIVLALIIYLLILKKKPNNQRNGQTIVQTKKSSIWQKPEIKYQNTQTGFQHYLIFDTETTGLPIDYRGDPNDLSNWPRIIQLSWIILDSTFNLVKEENHYINPNEEIPLDAIQIHGITNEFIQLNGKEIDEVLQIFMNDLESTQIIVAHNIDFDVPIIDAELLRLGKKRRLFRKRKFCTQKYGKGYSQIFGERRMFPSLPFLATLKYGGNEKDFTSHNSLSDVYLTGKIFQDIIEVDVIKEEWIRPK